MKFNLKFACDQILCENSLKVFLIEVFFPKFSGGGGRAENSVRAERN